MKLLIPCAVLILIGLACSNSSRVDPKTPPPSAGVFAPNKKADIQKQILDKIGKFPKAWDNIEFSKWENNAVTIYLNYKKMPSNMLEVELATKIIAKATLDVLGASGYSPKNEWLALFVHAQRRETGVTGSSVVRRFGKASYDFNNDSLTFEEVTK